MASVCLSFAAKRWRCFTNVLMTLRRYAFSRQHRAQFSEDVYAFVLWRYVVEKIWRVTELFVPGIVASTIQSPNFHLITNIKSFEFSTLCTTIPHQKLKSRLATIIRNSIIHKTGNSRYKVLVLCREGPYFVKVHSGSKSKYTEYDIVNMLEFLVDNIFVVFGERVSNRSSEFPWAPIVFLS